MGVPFIVASADIDEHLSGEPREVVMQLAKRKALAVAEQYPKDDILAADTLVHCSGESPQISMMLNACLGCFLETRTLYIREYAC